MANKILFESISSDAFKNAIFSSLQRQFDTLRISLSKIVTDEKNIAEVELRIRDLGYTEYQRVLQWFLSHGNKYGEVTTQETTDYSIDAKRYSVDKDNKIIAIIEKEKIKDVDDIEFDTRLSLVIEKTSKNKLTYKEVVAASKYNRIKKRISFMIGELIRVDMTEVSSVQKGKPVYSYECEIEFIKIAETLHIDDESVKAGKIFLYNIIKERQNSEMPYKQDKLRSMIAYLNNELGMENSNKGLDYKFLAPARNLKYGDIVTEGLIGGKYSYNVTIKADGVHKLLLFYGSGVWLVYPPHDFNLIAVSPGLLYINGVMFDGEDVPPENRKEDCKIDSKHLYIPFDTCLFPIKDSSNTSLIKSSNIQTKNQDERLQKAIEILTNPKLHLDKVGITVITKEFIPLGNSFESMATAVLKLNEVKDTLCYGTDGFMFTPINARYNTGTNSLPIYDRVLTKHPDICKLKLWKDLTIDLYTNIDSNPPSLIGRGINNILTPFIGTSKYPFDPAVNLYNKRKFFDNMKSSGIVEYKPKVREVIIGEEINKIYLLKPLKLRPDKTQPNRTDIAGAVWEDINDPIDIATFEGKTFRLHRHALNKVKRDLYATIPNKADIFEIGTGNGGQLYRWKRFHKVLGVEPDSKHIDEMNTRLKKYDSSLGKDEEKLETRVNVLQGGAEETKRIVKEAIKWFKWEQGNKIRPFYIVSMLSLSFFWKDVETFNSLVNTVQGLTQAYQEVATTSKSSVHFIFLTIDGFLVRQLFKEHTNIIVEENKKSLILGPCSMVLHPKGDNMTELLEVDIKDSIVRNQTEYLVNTEDLKEYIPLSKLEIKSANIETCMSQSERTYSSLFVSGIAKIGKTIQKKKLASPKNKSTMIKIKSVSDLKEEKVSFHIAPVVPDTIELRYRGRLDFMTTRWLNLKKYHQLKSNVSSDGKSNIVDVTQDDVESSSYQQELFGFSTRDSSEYQALGVLSLDCLGKEQADLLRGKDKIGGSTSSLISLINAILTCTDTEYQQEEDEQKRYTLCSRFYNKALKALFKETKYPSNDAKILNPHIRGWLPIVEMEKLILFRLVENKTINKDNLLYMDKEGQEKEAKKIPELKAFLKKYTNTGGNFFITETIYTGKDFQPAGPPLLQPYQFVYEKRKVIKQDKVKDVELMKTFLIEDSKDIKHEITKVERYYKWVGNYNDYVEYLNSISNEEYHELLLKQDNIDINSIFYNCRGGYLFRYYHSRGKSLPEIYHELTIYGIEEEGEEDEYYTQCFQFAFIADVYGINILGYSIPDLQPFYINDSSQLSDQPDSIGKIIPNPELTKTKKGISKKVDQKYNIADRRYCNVDPNFSFYTTALNSGLSSTIYFNDKWSKAVIGQYDNYLSEVGKVDILEYWNIIGNPMCGNIPNDDTNIKTYYHHFEVYSDGKKWFSKNIHNGDDPTKPKKIKGIYVPLGIVVGNSRLIKTVFTYT